MINAAVIGLGRWGKGIVEAVQGRSQRLRIVRGVSLEPDLVRDFAARHGFELGTDFEAAIRDPRVEAVLLATPHLAHVEQICAVAALGKPVWCEKPLALNLAEARRAVDAVAKAGVVFALGNNKRYYPSMLALKRLVAAGELGDVLHVEAHFTNEHSTRVSGGWRDEPAQSPGGGLTGAGLHLLDAFVNLAGPIANVDGRLFSLKPVPDPRDVATGLVRFRSGATGTFATVRAGPVYWRAHVFGTKGWAEARDETALTVALMGEPPRTRTFDRCDGLGELLDAFAIAIAGGAPFPVSTAQMLDTVAAFEATLRSIESGKPADVSG